MSKRLAATPGLVNSGHPQLTALRVNGEKQFLGIVARALRANSGVLVNAADALKVNRETLRKWIYHYPALQTAIDEARAKAKLEGSEA